MRFALLGDDARLLPLTRAALAAGHQLAWIGDVAPAGEIASLLHSLAPEASFNEPWESLLDVGYVDGVLVGRATRHANDSETAAALTLREEQLRKLVQVAVPVLVAHPVSRSMLFCYELDMIRRETQAVLQYYVPGLQRPLLADFATTIGLKKVTEVRIADFGPIEQITFVRQLRDRDRDAVLDQLAADVRLIMAACGELNRVLALGTQNNPAAFGTLAVQFSGPAGIPIRWSVEAADGIETAVMTAISPHAKCVLTMPASAHVWKLTEKWNPESAPSGSANFSDDRDDATEAMRSFASAIEHPTGASDWFAAAQSVELTDATERSLLKGRTIELHYEEYSQQATFKGRMSAIGCALIMVGLSSICLVGFVEYVWSTLFGWDPAALPWPLNKVHRYWPLLILAPMLLFLFIQVLPKLFPDSSEEEA